MAPYPLDNWEPSRHVLLLANFTWSLNISQFTQEGFWPTEPACVPQPVESTCLQMTFKSPKKACQILRIWCFLGTCPNRALDNSLLLESLTRLVLPFKVSVREKSLVFSNCEYAMVYTWVPCSLALVEPSTVWLWHQVHLTALVKE